MKSVVLIAAAVILFTVPAVAHDTSDVAPRQKTYRSEHLGASTLPPGQKTHWYKGHPGASYWAPGHQKRLYGATSGSREITTETTTRHGTVGSTRLRAMQPGNTSVTTTHRSK